MGDSLSHLDDLLNIINVKFPKSCKLESFSRYFLVGKSQERVLLNFP